MNLLTRVALALLLATSTAFAASTADEIAALESRLAAALAARDAKQLEALIAEPFVWVHSSDGRVDDRATWLQSASRGMALSGQRKVRSEFDVALTSYGEPAHTAVRISRVRLELQGRESWIRQTHTWVRDAKSTWKLAMGQGVLMYDGPPLDQALHARYGGTFKLEDGRKLVLKWQEPMLMVTFPNGATTQLFLASPTEELIRNPAAGAMRFSLDERGAPEEVALVRAGQEVWRAKREH